MTTVLVSVVRASRMMVIFTASHEERFHRTPAVDAHSKISQKLLLPVHPSIAVYPGLGCGGSNVRSPDLPLPGNLLLRLFQGNIKVFSNQPKGTISPACPGSPSNWTNCLSYEAPSRHPSQMPKPPQLAQLNVVLKP